MAALPALKAIKDELHISHSQIRTYLGCSLKYYFQYVQALPAERVGISLPFGGAIHSALEKYYCQMALSGKETPLPELQDFFEENFVTRLEAEEAQIIFNKTDLTDEAYTRQMGRSMLGVFHQTAKELLADYSIEGVEMPLGAELYDEDGREAGLLLIGVIDLLLQDKNGNVIAIDHKTAAKPYQQADVDADMQLSAYAYLLADQGYFTPEEGIECGFDVLRKLKTPKVETYRTRRTMDDLSRFHKTTLAVSRAIDARVFMPTRSWACADCGYADACKKWGCGR